MIKTIYCNGRKKQATFNGDIAAEIKKDTAAYTNRMGWIMPEIEADTEELTRVKYSPIIALYHSVTIEYFKM